ncbi:MAG TPA: Uma2 family endonuclease [Pirellulales bacterium]
MSTIARISIDQYEQMIAAGVFEPRESNRIELIRGELRKMSPIGPEHDDAVDYLNEWSMQSKPAAVRVRIKSMVALPKLKSAPEPDVTWLTRKLSGRHPQPADVLLIIEVAKSSLKFDRGEKARLYAKSGVRDYWVVNVLDRCIEVYREPLRARYQSLTTHARGEQVRPLAFPDVVLDVASLFDSIGSDAEES